MAKDGIYLPDGSFRSREQIVSDAYRNGEVIHRTPDKYTPHDFERINQEMIRRREFRQELEPYSNRVEIEIPTDRPVAVALLGDTHLGGKEVDYELVGDVVQLIKEHPLLYAYGMGDLMNALFFNSQEDLASHDEQTAHTYAMLRELIKKWLGFHTGEHDRKWVDKYGPTIYRYARELTGVPISNGPTIVKYIIGRGDKKQEYLVYQIHRPKGHSIYNDVHGLMRAATISGIQGADAYISAHTHTKSTASKVITGVGGAKRVVFGTTGPMQYGSDFGQNTLSYPEMGRSEAQLGPIFMLMRPDRKDIQLVETMADVTERLAPYLR